MTTKSTKGAPVTHVPKPDRARERRQAVGTFLGICGAVVLVTAGFLPIFFDFGSILTLGPFAFGLVSIAIYLATNYDRLTERFSERASTFIGVSVGQFVAAVALLIGGFSVLLNGAVVDPEKLSWDLTGTHVHSLSQQSLKVLKALKTPVRISAFYDATAPEAKLTKDLVARYQRVSNLISLRLLSPTADIANRQAYKITDDGPRIVVETQWDDLKKRREARFKISLSELNHEEKLTNALMKATMKARSRAYFVVGHGEAETRDKTGAGLSDLATDLEGEGYDVIPLNLITVGKVPSDAAVVIIAGPQQPLLPPEAKQLISFADRGGNLAVLLEPGTETGMDGLLGSFGVMANHDIVIDLSPFGQMFGGGPDTSVAVDYADHPITAKFNNAVTVYNRARSLAINPGTDANPTSFIRTGEKTWGETDFSGLQSGDAQWDAGEARGPVSIGVVAERKVNEKLAGKLSDTSRMVVVGDASFITNQFRSLGANRNLTLNILGWLTEQDDKIAVRPTTRGGNLIVLTPEQRERVAFLVLYGMPVTLLSIGLGIWLVRRQR